MTPEEIAAVLREHLYQEYGTDAGVCLCGSGPNRVRRSRAQQYLHVAEALAAMMSELTVREWFDAIKEIDDE